MSPDSVLLFSFFERSMDMKEIWKDVEGYAGAYEVSNFGNVKSNKTRKLLAQSFCKDKYLKATYSNKGITKEIQTHSLVAKLFIDNPDDKKYVNHINGIKTDNRAENLEWVTAKENVEHSIKNGLAKDIPHNGNQFARRPVFAENLKTKEIYRYESLGEANRALGIKVRAISRVCYGGCKSSKGFTFRFA
jgi:hypothetical protein